MELGTTRRATPALSVPAARLALAAVAASVAFLGSLHLLSPEFDPSWRVVSEYAYGKHGWALLLMFASGALGSWALAFAIRSQVPTRGGRIGLAFLVAAGVGGAMGALFDIHHPLHGLAGGIGVLSFPVAAVLISASLGRAPAWAAARRSLLWTAHSTWATVVLMTATFALMIGTLPSETRSAKPGTVTTLPAGVIALVGYANRLLLLSQCAWAALVAWRAIALGRRERAAPSPAIGPSHRSMKSRGSQTGAAG